MIVVSSLVAVAGCASAPALAASTPTAAPSGAGSSPVGGTVVYADNFSNPYAGWWTGTTPAGDDVQFRNGAYEVTPARGKGFVLAAPYEEGQSELSIGATFQLPDRRTSAGGGVTCGWPSLSYAHYEFTVHSDGDWAILRAMRTSLLTAPDTVVSGQLKDFSAGLPVTIVGECADRESTGDRRVTRLSMYVNGVQVAGLNDTFNEVTGTQWRAGVVAGQVDQGPLATMRFTNFELRVPMGAPEATSRAQSWAPLFVLAGIFAVGIALSRLAGKRRRRREQAAREAMVAAARAAAAPPPPTSPWGFPVRPGDSPGPPGSG